MVRPVLHEVELDGLRLRVAPCCDKPTCGGRIGVVGAVDEDRWLLLATVLPQDAAGADPDWLYDSIKAAIDDPRWADRTPRWLAVFGRPWDQLSQELMRAQTQALVEMPPWLEDEFAHQDPTFLRGLCDLVKAADGRSESLAGACEALKVIRYARLHTDRLP